MIEGDPQTATADAGLSTTATTSRPALAPCRVYKFAPKYGFVDTQDDMLIFLTRKLDVKKDGGQSSFPNRSQKTSSFFSIARIGLQVRFECETSDGPWSETVPEIDLKDRMLSFKIPIFPFWIETMVHVNVTLSQNDQPVESLPFYYSPKCNRRSQFEVGRLDSVSCLSSRSKFNSSSERDPNAKPCCEKRFKQTLCVNLRLWARWC